MLTIPLPFIATVLLIMTALLMPVRRVSEWKRPCVFILLCAASTAIVGLRWTWDIALLRFLQPIIGACVPVSAWICFAAAHRANARLGWHALGPVLITLWGLADPIWRDGIDLVLSLLYLGYGVALISTSFQWPTAVRMHSLRQVLLAQRIAGGGLLFSAVIDASLAYDFWYFAGQHAYQILSVGYLTLIPALVVSVVTVSRCTPMDRAEATDRLAENAPLSPTPRVELAASEASHIIQQIEKVVRESALYRDPDLTLNRLSRRAGIPARQISMAINQLSGENISRWLNAYRIEYAASLLLSSTASITEVYLQAGFHSKSNFNREFSRITGQTPSEYRQNPRYPISLSSD